MSDQSKLRFEWLHLSVADKNPLNWRRHPKPQIDRAAELQQKWATEVGQLWIIPSKALLGRAHRLLCGDSTKAEDVARLFFARSALIKDS